MKQSFMDKFSDYIKKEEIKGQIKLILSPLTDIVVSELYPYIYIIICFMCLMLILILIILILVIQLHIKIYK